VPLVEHFELQHIDAATGSIVVAQGERDLPFAIKRVYFLHSVPADQTRGLHAHKTLVQLAVCVKGSCRFHLDDGRDSADVVLSSPHHGIVIRPMLWREMSHFSSDCVLLVLASEHYDEADYIRSYEEFKRVITAG
jgi:UDP-2-acetamido-3-amino-2,3-dideoxy-glucuronate N-acetyltransferase